MITGSSLDAALVCAAAAALPHVGDTGSDASDAGDARHLFLAHVDPADPTPALALVPEEHRNECAQLHLDQCHLGAGFETEVAFALDFRSGTPRRLGRLIDRRYIEHGVDFDRDVPGTADVVSTPERSRADGFVTVDDYKGAHAPLPAAEHAGQLLLAAICAAELHGVPRARVRFSRTLEDGELVHDEADLDAVDLAFAKLRIMDALSRGAAARARRSAGALLVDADMVQGDHCASCPALTTCPAMGQLVRLMAIQPVAMVDELRELMRWNPGAALAKHRLLSKLLAEVDGALHAVAAEHPIPVAGGKVWGPRVSNRRELDGRVTHAVLEARLGRAVADAAVGYESSQAAIERALRPLVNASGGAMKITHAVRDVVAEVERRNGVTPKQTTTYREYRVRESEEKPAANEAVRVDPFARSAR